MAWSEGRFNTRPCDLWKHTINTVLSSMLIALLQPALGRLRNPVHRSLHHNTSMEGNDNDRYPQEWVKSFTERDILQ